MARRSYKRDKNGRFARVPGLGKALAKRKERKTQKRAVKRQKAIANRDSTYWGLRTTQNQFTDKQARAYVALNYSHLKGVPIGSRPSSISPSDLYRGSGN